MSDAKSEPIYYVCDQFMRASAREAAHDAVFRGDWAAASAVHATIKYSAHAQLMEAAEALAKVLALSKHSEYWKEADGVPMTSFTKEVDDAIEKFEAFKKAGGK